MADTHTPINEEVEVTLKLKVKLTMASYYQDRTEEQLRHEIETAKNNLENTLTDFITNDYFGEIGASKWGYVNFRYEVERKEE